MEFARELVTHFSRGCAALKVAMYEALCDLVVLEQFKCSVPSHIATYLSEHNVKTAAEAAKLADEYVLTHGCELEHRGWDDVYRADGYRYCAAGNWQEGSDTHGGRPEQTPTFDPTKIMPLL